jgi:multidrug efflux pump subunit AcrA (membrane-fusion protein)
MENEQAPAVAEETGEVNSLKIALIIVVVIYVLGSGYFMYDLSSRLDKLGQQQKAAALASDQRNEAIMERLGMTENSLKQSAEVLQSRLTRAQREAAARATALGKQQEQTEQQLQQSQQQISSVSTDLGGVKTELTGARGDIVATKTDLDATKKKLDSTIGDLGVQSGLIAHTRDDLEILKHKGDRNIYEFTLSKGTKRPTPVGTISMQLKKVDAKKGKFTLDVVSDDRTITKKDRNVAEPLQFYSGRDRMLYEVVVFTAEKNSISGYLSTPKNAPQPGVIAQ